MGFNNEFAERVIFDLETVACPDARDLLDPVKAPSNYRDPAKIAAYVAEKTDEIVSKAALEVDLCEIVATGWMVDDEPAVLTRADYDEATLIKFAWEVIANRAVVGFNTLSYDLPVLIRRSQLLGIRYPSLNLDRYRTPHVDLLQKLTWNGTTTYRSLNFFCRRFKIANEDRTCGADVAGMVARGDWAGVKQHNYSDLVKTAALARKLGYLAAPVSEAVGF